LSKLKNLISFFKLGEMMDQWMTEGKKNIFGKVVQVDMM